MDVGMQIRKEFPFFNQEQKRWVYFDNGATTQKPHAVIERMVRYYTSENSNIHRGNYFLSSQTERMYEHARATIAEWIDAEDACEVVFTKSSTEAINLVAAAVRGCILKSGDNVIVTELEHSSNYYPWKACCEACGADFRAAEAEKTGDLKAEQVIAMMDDKTRLIAITAMSNVTGFRPDLEQIITVAHRRGIYVFVDASQEIVHHKISVREMNCDFLCFSGHKLYAPMGIGVLYGKKELLERMNPYLYGGDMVKKEDSGNIVYKQDSLKYEAGTQNISGALGLEAAIQFLETSDFEKLMQYEHELGNYLRTSLQNIPGIRLLGIDEVSSVLSFESERYGAYDIGVLLGMAGIAVRCGAHCAYPLMARMKKESVCRVSLAFYNTKEEIDRLAECLRKSHSKSACAFLRTKPLERT